MFVISILFSIQTIYIKLFFLNLYIHIKWQYSFDLNTNYIINAQFIYNFLCMRFKQNSHCVKHINILNKQQNALPEAKQRIFTLQTIQLFLKMRIKNLKKTTDVIILVFFSQVENIMIKISSVFPALQRKFKF